MIYVIQNINDPLAGYLNDDPVRPHIPHDQRFGTNRTVLALTDGNQVNAVVCARLCNTIPKDEQEMPENQTDNPDTVVFYTIWSYKPGAGQQLIREGLEKLKNQLPMISRYVTLSPPTDMAKKFHIRNGAEIFRVNTSSVNYEYKIN